MNGQPSSHAYYAYDGHGSVRELTNDAGAVTDRYDYDAFGNLLFRAGTTANAHQYCGEHFDTDLGLYYLRARYLNPDSGRFWSMDPYEGDSGDPASLHKYTYANASPVNYSDPSGRFSISEIMHAAQAIGTLAMVALPTIQAVTSASLPYLAALGAAAFTNNILQFTFNENFRRHRLTTTSGAVENALDATVMLGGAYRAFETTLRLLRGAIASGRASVEIASTTAPIFEVGVNVTPRSVAVQYRTIGGQSNGFRTSVTTPETFEKVIGPLTGSRIVITRAQAQALENALGLNANSLERVNIISIVDRVRVRAPASPVSGNAQFLGGATGLPSGAPELTTSAIPTAGGTGITQIILEVIN